MRTTHLHCSRREEVTLKREGSVGLAARVRALLLSFHGFAVGGKSGGRMAVGGKSTLPADEVDTSGGEGYQQKL